MIEPGTPTEAAPAVPAAPTEHVSIAENGAFVLSQEALDAMDSVQPYEEPAPEEEATPAAVTAAVIAAAPPTRTIKHNGQAVEVPAGREVEYLQKGYDYEHRMQGLEQERAKLQSWNGLVSAIEASPKIRAEVSAILGYTPESAAPQTPQFDDPIEQLKWETVQATLKAVQEQFITPMQQQQQQTTYESAMELARGTAFNDPQFPQIKAEILASIGLLPQSLRQNHFNNLDKNPALFMEAFHEAKARLKPTAAVPQPQATAPQPTKRETKAPLLESGLNAVAPAAQQAQTDHIKALEKRSRNGDFRATGELMALMA